MLGNDADTLPLYCGPCAAKHFPPRSTAIRLTLFPKSCCACKGERAPCSTLAPHAARPRATLAPHADTAAQAANQWMCPRCTLQNPDDAARCGACQGGRPRADHAPAVCESDGRSCARHKRQAVGGIVHDADRSSDESVCRALTAAELPQLGRQCARHSTICGQDVPSTSASDVLKPFHLHGETRREAISVGKKMEMLQHVQCTQRPSANALRSSRSVMRSPGASMTRESC